MTTKKQKRRSISVRGDIYEKVHTFCKDQNVSMSSFVEDRILRYLDNPVEDLPAPEVEVVAMPDKPAPLSNTPITPPAPTTSHIQGVANLSDQQLIDEMKQHFTF